MGEFADFNSAWDDWVDMENKPTRACVESKLVSSPCFKDEEITNPLLNNAEFFPFAFARLNRSFL